MDILPSHLRSKIMGVSRSRGFGTKSREESLNDFILDKCLVKPKKIEILKYFETNPDKFGLLDNIDKTIYPIEFKYINKHPHGNYFALFNRIVGYSHLIIRGNEIWVSTGLAQEEDDLNIDNKNSIYISEKNYDDKIIRNDNIPNNKEFDLLTLYNILVSRKDTLNLPSNFPKKVVLDTFHNKLNLLDENNIMELIKFTNYVYFNSLIFNIEDIKNLILEEEYYIGDMYYRKFFTISDQTSEIIRNYMNRGYHLGNNITFITNDEYKKKLKFILNTLLPKLEEALQKLDKTHVMSQELENVYGIDKYIMYLD